MTVEVNIRRKFSNSKNELVVHNTEMPSPEGNTAMVFIERWGMVMVDDAGEDASGRQKSRLMTPAEILEIEIVSAGRQSGSDRRCWRRSTDR